MSRKFKYRERPLLRIERQKSYTEFYSSFIEELFNTDQDFIGRVQSVLDSGKLLPGAFERGDELGVFQCAYLLRFGVHDACLAEEKFRESSVECDKLETLCSKERINICCLGSQALLSVLGICRVIDEYTQKFKFSGESRTRVQILIVDKNKSWKVLSEYIVAAAKKEYPALQLKLDFSVKDVAKGFSEEAKQRIELSHILIMFKFLSNLPSEETVATIVTGTLKTMKKNAVLFFLDHDIRGELDNVEKLIAKSKSFKKIKSSGSPEKYILLDDTMLLHKNLYQFLAPLNEHWDINSTPPMTFATWIKNPDVKIRSDKEKEALLTKTTPSTFTREMEDPDKFYRAKKSSNTKRNSTEKFRLVGKFFGKDMEKKNKDDSKRVQAKEAASSRYANFDDY